MMLLLLTAWLAAGLVIAWVIGRSSDLGKPLVEWRNVAREGSPQHTQSNQLLEIPLRQVRSKMRRIKLFATGPTH